MEPRYSFVIADPANAVTLAIFLLIGTMFSILSELPAPDPAPPCEHRTPASQ